VPFLTLDGPRGTIGGPGRNRKSQKAGGNQPDPQARPAAFSRFFGWVLSQACNFFQLAVPGRALLEPLRVTGRIKGTNEAAQRFAPRPCLEAKEMDSTDFGAFS
jgi:hypothetical protein